MNKKKEFTEGSVVKISLSDTQICFGRLYPGYHLAVYKGIYDAKAHQPSIENIITQEVCFYIKIFKDIITMGIFKIIGFQKLTLTEIENLPPHFSQDLVDIQNCVIYYDDGRSQPATPEKCLNLEGPVIWEADGLVSRILDHYAGKKNPYTELHRVILTKDDPRYLAGPHLKWSFTEEKFYRTDK